jgi:hypothetical protein
VSVLWPEQWETHYLPLNFLDRVNEPPPEPTWRFFTEPRKLRGLGGKGGSPNAHTSGSDVVDLRLDALSHQAQNCGVELAIDKGLGQSPRTRPFVSNRYSSTPPNVGEMLLGGRSCRCVQRFRRTLEPRCWRMTTLHLWRSTPLAIVPQGGDQGGRKDLSYRGPRRPSDGRGRLDQTVAALHLELTSEEGCPS